MKFLVFILALLSFTAQAQPYINPDHGERYYIPQQRPPYLGQPFPYGFPGRGYGGNGPSQYYWNPRQSGPYDPYHGMPRMDYFSPCRSNPYACGWPP